MSLKTQSSINLPQSISLSLTLNSPHNSANMNRYLVFKNFEDKEIELKFTLNQDPSGDPNKLSISNFPDTTHNLQVLGSMNHRSYWDRIFLKNKGGSKELDIQLISLSVHYVRGVSGAIRDIPLLVDYPLNQVLAQDTEIALSTLIESSVMNWAGISNNDHPIAVMVAKDLGKSGTSSQGFDQWGSNPKYRGWLGYECSEFVSWYVHAAFVQVTNYNGFPMNAFRDITFTGEMHTIFSQHNKTYFFHSGQRKFLAEWNPNIEYIPKAGDLLLRKMDGTFEHSMIFLRMEESTNVATVIDGPYLISLREVDILEMETRDENQKDFVICEV